MASNFPTALDELVTNQSFVDGTSIVQAAPWNKIQDAVDKLQAKVGVDGSSVVSSIDFLLERNYVKLIDLKGNVAGGTSPSAAWTTRTLNTKSHDVGNLCTLSSNLFTLEPGTYRIHASAPATNVHGHIARLWNDTTSAEVILGTTAWASVSVYTNTRSFISGLFEAEEDEEFKISHYTEYSKNPHGLGEKSGHTSNIYTVVELWRIGPTGILT